MKLAPSGPTTEAINRVFGPVGTTFERYMLRGRIPADHESRRALLSRVRPIFRRIRP